MAASRAGSSSESREGEESDIFSSNQVSVRLTESVSVASNLRFGVRRLAEGYRGDRSIRCAVALYSEPKAMKKILVHNLSESHASYSWKR